MPNTTDDRLKEVQRSAMQSLSESGLENVCDTAFAFNANGFTPNYLSHVLELPLLANLVPEFQLRVVGSNTAHIRISAASTDAQVRQATQAALRKLMLGMREQAAKWLAENPADGS